MVILCLLEGCFDVGREDAVAFSELSNQLDDAFVADFSDVDFDAAQIEDDVGEKAFFDDSKVF